MKKYIITLLIIASSLIINGQCKIQKAYLTESEWIGESKNTSWSYAKVDVHIADPSLQSYGSYDILNADFSDNTVYVDYPTQLRRVLLISKEAKFEGDSGTGEQILKKKGEAILLYPFEITEEIAKEYKYSGAITNKSDYMAHKITEFNRDCPDRFVKSIQYRKSGEDIQYRYIYTNVEYQGVKDPFLD